MGGMNVREKGDVYEAAGAEGVRRRRWWWWWRGVLFILILPSSSGSVNGELTAKTGWNGAFAWRFRSTAPRSNITLT